MMLLKGCHRCRGDLRINKDIYGEYKQCVQCGYMEGIEPRAVPLTAARPEKKAA